MQPIRILFAFLGTALMAGNSPAQVQHYVRIGTGGTWGTYYPIGVLVAQAVSQPGRIAVTAQTSNGSLGNVIGIAGGSLETGFAQADVATWAQQGSGIFEGRPKLSGLRLIANLYPENLHIVVRKDSGIASVADLRGKRVALDESGSGTLVNARQVLAVYGLTEADVKPEYIKPKQASDKLRAATLDAFFFTAGTPAAAISELAAGAQWVTSDKIDAELVYQLTEALYGDAAQKALASGHPKGRFITLQNALKGDGIALHPGAMRFFKEAGVLK